MLTTHEAADRLGLTARSVARLIKRGMIVATKRGRDYLIDLSEVERYTAKRREPGRPRKGTTMTAEEAIQLVRETVTRQEGPLDDLIVEHKCTRFGNHEIRVSYTRNGKTHEYTEFKSIRGFSSGVVGLDGRSLGDPGTRR